MKEAGSAHGKEASEGGRVSGREGKLCGCGWEAW